MSLEAAKILSTKSETKLPENIEIMDQFWYTENGGSAGGVAVYKKYGRVGGDPIIRKRRWQEWWENIGKFKKQSILEARPIKKPGASKYLAEYAGILMGDGGLTQYQSLITLNCVDDLEYSKFVVKLIEKLFKISPSVVFRKNSRVLTIRLSRVNHVKFLVSIGIVIGNKIGQQIDIPVWIRNNMEYAKACVRGLVDTDGCLVIHRYKSNNKLYTYKKVDFTSRSKPLLNAVSNILSELHIKHGVRRGSQIRIEARKDVETYFKLIGSHNPKHLNRYKN